MTKKQGGILTGLALLVISFPLAFQLGQAPIQTWDESRQAVNALEMARSGGQWLVTTFAHHPDLGNTKPPLLIWLQALSIAALGPTELAVRLPSLLAALGTVGLLYLAGRRVGRPGWGLLAGAVLTTTAGYLGPHLARSGDYEALLCAWIMGQVLAGFAYAETGRARYLALAAVAVAGAVLTKGVVGLLALPALALYVLLAGKLRATLRRPAFWLAAGGALALPGLYYLLREQAAPGYWAAVRTNELGGRYLHNLSAASRSPWYYVHILGGYQLRPWWPLLPVAAGALLASPPSAARRLGGLLALVAGSWLLLISVGQTKLEWYDAPMLPPLALLLGLGLGAAFEWLKARWLLLGHALAGLSLALGLLVVPYGLTLKRLVHEPQNNLTWGGLNSHGAYLRQYARPLATRQPLLVYWPTPAGGAWAFQFYQEVLAERHVPITRCDPDSLPSTLAPGARVLVCLPQLRARLLRRYAVRLVDQREQCTLYEVQGAANKQVTYLK